MSHLFQDTPVSLLSCLQENRGGFPNEKAWSAFFNLYHGPIRAVALSVFRRYNWKHVPDAILDDVILDVVTSFFKADFSYDPSRGKFRHYLRQLTTWRVKDTLARLPKGLSLPFEEVAEAELSASSLQPDGELEAREVEVYRATLLATLLEDVRSRVSPQTFLMFEMVKIFGCSPEEVAARFKVKRNVVDNASHRVLKKLRELALQPEYRKEYEA